MIAWAPAFLIAAWFATIIAFAKVKAQRDRAEQTLAVLRFHGDGSQSVTLDEFDLYALQRGAHWTFGEPRVKAALLRIHERARLLREHVEGQAALASPASTFEEFIESYFPPPYRTVDGKPTFGLDEMRFAWEQATLAAGER